jgi:heme/copper-type cytochrome/quinol oxidase subunit 2
MIPEIDFSARMPTRIRKNVTFTADMQPGDYTVHCSIFCGPKHGQMQGKLIVLPESAEKNDQKDNSETQHGDGRHKHD